MQRLIVMNFRKFEDAKKTFEQQGPDGDMDEPLPPQKPDKRDSVQSKGTFYGALASALCVWVRLTILFLFKKKLFHAYRMRLAF